jgi:hypothetical protein
MAERIAKVSLDFIELTPTQKGMFGINVIQEMTGHPLVFPTPDIPLATLESVNETLIGKIQQAMSGDKEKIAERDAAEKVWDTNFRKQAEYVQRIASGDKVIIIQSGYHHTDTEAEPVAPPDAAVLSAWGNKTPGSIHAEIEPIAKIKGILFIASPQPLAGDLKVINNQVKMSASVTDTEGRLTTKRKVDFEGLVSGTRYYIAVITFNATGTSPVSNIKEVIAP